MKPAYSFWKKLFFFDISLCLDKMIRWFQRSVIFLPLFFAIFAVSSFSFAASDPLSSEERAWLKQHDGKIIISADTYWPPITFLDENSNLRGISQDYKKLLEEKLNFRFKQAPPQPWEKVMADFYGGKIDAVPAMLKDEERAKKVFFTKSYFEVPTVIVTGSKFKEDLSLEKMQGLRVAVPKDYLIHKYLVNTYPHLSLVTFSDVKSCLFAVVAGGADAAVANLAAASYIIAQEGITNLKMAGYDRFRSRIHFASKKEWPILNRILDKGLDLITPEERAAIYRKWIHLEVKPFYKKGSFWSFTLAAFLLTVALVASILVWNRKLKKEVEKRTASLEKRTRDLKIEVAVRKGAEKDLQKEQAFLEALVQTIPDLVWLRDPKGKYLSCNRKFEEYIGASLEEIKGRTDFEFIDKYRAERFFQEDRKAILSNGPVTKEETIVYGNGGNSAILETIKTPMYDRTGGLIGVLGIGRDITLRKQAEKALAGSRDQLVSILSNLQGITYRCMMDEHWTMIFMSGYVERLTGYPAEEFINNKIRTYESIIHPEETRMVSDEIHRAVRSGDPWELEYRIIHKDGGECWVYEKGSAVFNDDGSVDCLDGFIINITRQKIMEEHFSQTQKLEAIGILAGGIAHDFNNILGGILGFSELIQEDLKQIDCPDSMHKRIDNVIKGGLRAKELVAQILAFSRSEKDQVEPVNMTIITKEVAKLLTATLPRTIEIKHSFDSKSMVLGDVTKLHQVLMNLCTNAGHAMREKGGELAISVDEIMLDKEVLAGRKDVAPGLFVRLSVADTGHGMDEKTRLKIMEPFFTTKSREEGTGMGLWVVQGIISGMGGFIEVGSTLGEGSRFDVFMPVFDNASAEKSIKSGTMDQVLTGSEHILFVDDEKTLTQFAKEFLSDLGYKVTVFNSPTEAFEQFSTAPETYDLVITDLSMPGLTGDVLCREIRSIRPEMGIVLTSGILENCGDDALTEFDAVLKKPVLINKMAKTIRAVLKKYNEGEMDG